MLSRAKQDTSTQQLSSLYELRLINHTSNKHNLKVPYWAAVAAEFYLSYLAFYTRLQIPESVNKQAILWSRFWHANFSFASDFVSRVRNMSLPCASAGADILFIVDSSGGINIDEYDLARQFISNVIDALDIGENAFQVAIDIFSEGAQHSLDFVNCSDKAKEKRVAQNLEHMNGGSDTTSALAMALNSSFTSAHGARSAMRAFPPHCGCNH